jgi:nitrite reductase/ring-hydroxylating ferredoxin subunit
VSTISKFKYFSGFVAFVLIFVSCYKENDVIPDVTVKFMIDLNDARFVVALGTIGGTVTVDGQTNNDGAYADGYSGNGIIITRGTDNFFAYDRTCPYDYTIGNNVRIDIDTKSFATAICPKCGTTYQLLSNGTPSGIGKYSLKSYSTSFDERYLNVWNNR